MTDLITGMAVDFENESCPGCGWIGATITANHRLQCRRCDADRGVLSEAQVKFLNHSSIRRAARAGGYHARHEGNLYEKA